MWRKPRYRYYDEEESGYDSPLNWYATGSIVATLSLVLWLFSYGTTTDKLDVQLKAARSVYDTQSASILAKKPKPEYVIPVDPEWWIISSRFGGWRGHKGLDFAVKTGERAYASHAGVVIEAGWHWKEANYGKLVVIKFGDVKLYYAHLSKIKVKVGDEVEAGDVIGLVGNTGFSTGPHLHFGVKIDGVFVDPEPWLRKHVK